MNIEKIRQDFPLLQAKFKGQPMIYFDNACQTLRPQSMIDAIINYYQNYPACAGRSVHRLGEKVSRKCAETRRIVAKFIGAKRTEEIIFTRNTTEGINMIARSLGLRAGDVVLTTDKEHNSNLIPWQLLSEKEGIIHRIVPSREDNTFSLEKFKELLESLSGTVKLVAMVFTSNLDGVSIPAKEIIQIAHQHGAQVLLDAAQTIAHHKIDVQKLDVDFLAFSGHKMFGPSGTGVLYGKYQLLEKLAPFLVGGETVAYSNYEGYELLPPPEKFEAGLQNYAGIIGLGEAVRYIEKIGFKNIIKQEYELNKFITAEILKMPTVKLIGPADPALRAGIISFHIPGLDSHQVALILDEAANIMVRSGQHCVHSWFAAKSLQSSVRVSLAFYNNQEEARIFIENLRKITKLL